MKALQLFTDQSLKQGKQLGTDEILKFLEDFRLLHGVKELNRVSPPKPSKRESQGTATT